jgi:hypothetical protein
MHELVINAAALMRRLQSSSSWLTSNETAPLLRAQSALRLSTPTSSIEQHDEGDRQRYRHRHADDEAPVVVASSVVSGLLAQQQPEVCCAGKFTLSVSVRPPITTPTWIKQHSVVEVLERQSERQKRRDVAHSCGGGRLDRHAGRQSLSVIETKFWVCACRKAKQEERYTLAAVLAREKQG